MITSHHLSTVKFSLSPLAGDKIGVKLQPETLQPCWEKIADSSLPSLGNKETLGCRLTKNWTERVQGEDSAAHIRFSSTRLVQAQLKFETDAHENAHVDVQYCILTPPAVLYMYVTQISTCKSTYSAPKLLGCWPTEGRSMLARPRLGRAYVLYWCNRQKLLVADYRVWSFTIGTKIKRTRKESNIYY